FSSIQPVEYRPLNHATCSRSAQALDDVARLGGAGRTWEHCQSRFDRGVIDLHAGVREDAYREQGACLLHEGLIGHDDCIAFRDLTRRDAFKRVDVCQTVMAYYEAGRPNAHDASAFETKFNYVLPFILVTVDGKVDNVLLNYSWGMRLKVQIKR